MKFAVQLYSLRHHMEQGEDLLDILKKVKEIGFDGVEFAGFWGYDADTLKKTLDDLGLVCVGAHLGMDDLKADKVEDTIKFMQTLGAKTMGIGGGPTQTDADLSNMLEIMGGAQKAADKYGMKVYFHTHTEEFHAPADSDNPATIFERLKEVCYVQVDTYWSFVAGIDNYPFITANRDRIPHLHIKDGIDGHPLALGEGNNDLAAVIKVAKDTDIEWLILENDDPEPDGISDITRSMGWLKKNGK